MLLIDLLRIDFFFVQLLLNFTPLPCGSWGYRVQRTGHDNKPDTGGSAEGIAFTERTAARTAWPCASDEAHKAEPTKPEAPVITMRFMTPAIPDTSAFESIF
jgi:hypothetical protein